MGFVAVRIPAKLPIVAVGLPLATWLGIRAYWEWLRWCGEAPTYYVASMAVLRACVTAPLQLLMMGVLVTLERAAVIRASWMVVCIAHAAAALLGAVGDAIGMHVCELEGSVKAHIFWDLSPHLVGLITFLFLVVGSRFCRRPVDEVRPNDHDHARTDQGPTDLP